MRTSALQYLYLQKPVSTVVLLCLISVLPWISTGDFSTKGEPREAAVAVSMLETGNWVLPRAYADEFAYKPPMAHWMMAMLSMPGNKVSEFTSRLPSALAYTLLMTFVLLFWGDKVRFQEAFIATLVLMLCIEIHRAGMTARVDMLLTAFTVTALFRLFHWENTLELKGLPILIPLLLSGAVLTKGPVGVILPLFVFGVYLLMLRKYSLFKIAKSLFYIGLASLFVPSIWYIEAWMQGGNHFVQLVLAENLGRFFHLAPTQITYDLGHENGAWYNLLTLAAGFMPWTLLLFFSLFGLRISRPSGSPKVWADKLRTTLATMDKTTLFSLTAALCIVFFYSLPSSKRSVYLMPAYPFIALFIARYIIYLTEHRAHLIRLFAGVLATVVSALMLVSLIQLTGLADLYTPVASRYAGHAATLETIRLVALALAPGWKTIAILLLLLLSMFTVFYQIRKKIHIKILYATLFLVFCTHLYVDGIIMSGIRNQGSARLFAAEIKRDYPVTKTNLFVMNDLRQYRNLYGLNFYLGNCFRNFASEQPQTGYLLATEEDYPRIAQRYDERYRFDLLRISDRVVLDTKRRIVLSRFEKR